MARVDVISAPGTVSGLATDTSGRVYAAVLIDRGEAYRSAALLHLDGDRLLETGLEAPAASYAIADGPGGPWWIDGSRARSIVGGEVRDMTAIVGDEHSPGLAIHGEDTFVASVVGIAAGDAGVGRIRRVDGDGAVAWTADLPRGPLAFEGVRQMRAATGWKSEPMPPWEPRQWEPYERPLISGGLVVASFFDFSSGIGIRYGLAADDGGLIWATRPGPLGNASVLAEGEVAIGSQGYGAFESELRGRTPEPLARWPSHGKGVAIDGALVVIEMNNARVDRCHVVRWRRDGSIERGARLPGYHSTEPARRADGALVFARGKSLWAATPSLAIADIAKLDGKTWLGRTLVLGDGAVLVSDLSPRIWRVR